MRLDREQFKLELDELMQEDLDEIFDINIDSLWHLEQELKNHSKMAARFQRLAAMAGRLVNDLTLELGVITAEIVDEIYNSDNPPPQSARAEIRRTKVPLYDRYRNKVEELNEAKQVKEMLQGFVYSLVSRERRIKEIVKIAERTLKTDGSISDDTFKRKRINTRIREASQQIEY